MVTEDISILQKTYELYKTFYQYSENFPKKDRFSLGLRCENFILELIENIIKASKSRRENKTIILYEVSTKLDMLKIFVRLMKELRILDLKKYTVIQEFLHEIGKMLGGWIRSVQPK